MNLAFVLATRDRPRRLRRTLDALASLDTTDVRAQVIVADNASSPPVTTARELDNGIPVEVVRLERNEGAAGRNRAARATDPSCEWIVMLDDDSHPLDMSFARALRGRSADALCVMADVHLPARGRRESGGLPEVFIGCGAAIRRSAFLEAGGYDPAFDYYAEEYDLCARLLLMGGRTGFDGAWRVEHHKVGSGRDMGRILHRLVRNNGWVVQRYAPEADRRAELRAMRARYRAIGEREGARAGVARGLAELRRTIGRQRRTPLPRALWDRFTGLAHAREALARAWAAERFDSATIVAPGKNAHLVARAIEELGVRITGDADAEARVIGTLSPGPMLDALERGEARGGRLIAPWAGCGAPCGTSSARGAARSGSLRARLAGRAT